MIYRVTFGFEGKGQGWSETHAMINANRSPEVLEPTLADIASKRAQFLGNQFSINAIRISRYSEDNGPRIRGVHPIKGTWRTSVTGEAGEAEPAAVALLCRGISLDSQVQPKFDANTNQTFLGAPFDRSVDTGGQVYPGRGGLQAAFGSWRQAMLNASMGWLASDTILQADIATITEGVNGIATFTTIQAISPPLADDGVYKVRIKGVNGGVSPLNGEMIIRVTGTSTFVSRYPIGWSLAQIGGSVRFYANISPFIQYGDLRLVLEAANHKRGRPFGSKPGRRRKRVRA